ncbi:MAG: hypothetical protein A2504_15040 [Bdellovibrionales bacterium RIFOXYD12_FULL_39_22]|nr:MAG: hypothetical protein A2385_02470 [Bdellovibrionales bacterium RIFOXYB1_FULL_39_21]OFZ43111.1 MAG: hypothetical protein A2485_11615 [Bdellovibrionales bacterium RIFOXYC12_FULL_39_17]OFZ47849.1 MAG: hypothetical protein A2404_16255 [Bdellovibrionales bacterium RIFOXYC1_FULL_39_130]OFZ71807.1 MAG: hypothetical protein A2451_09670 [Bdellovibrionales bacterium RIFOXYC2_FULL_39_8]OFZ75629.1 MAG: hypothetical protein A2560_12755 [Bdellovibrionales bacterium RIFOXYD1_FULL_39_84]OFZ94119.1 MAG:
MADSVTYLLDGNNETVILACLILATVRIYLEVIRFDFAKLPISRVMAERLGQDRIKTIHRTGLYLSIGYIVLFSPQYLIG